jgi:hypothetical protein
MKIQYLAEYSMPEIVHINSVHLEDRYPGISTWKHEEIKDIPHDLTARFRINGESHYISLIEDLLSNRDFKIITADMEPLNPNFMCSLCDGPAYEDAIMHPKTGHGVPLTINEERVCKSCWDKAPKNLTPTGFEFQSTEE